MSRFASLAYSISLDGLTGPAPTRVCENPLGVRWRGNDGLGIPDAVFRMHGWPGRAAAKPAWTTPWPGKASENVGAWIMGRNMFGPVRGPWPDEAWRGWWGEEPASRLPGVRAHASCAGYLATMKGGTDFHFVTGGTRGAGTRQGRGRRAATCESAAARRRFASTCRPAHRRAAPGAAASVVGPRREPVRGA